MSRGDKRERDRAKTQAKLAAKSKGATREGRPLDRNEADKAALAAKVEAKKKQKEAEEAAATGGTGGVIRKPKPKKNDSDLDALLSAGLGPVKKKGVKA